MDYKLTKLDNGLRVLTVVMPSLESATLTLWVKTGSRFEDKRIRGISHFIEHMAFKGGKKYKSAKIVSETLEGMGADFNAATSKELTSFYVKVRTDLIEKAFDVLSDIIFSPVYKEEELKKEKGVIIEEISMQEDNPSDKVSLVFTEMIFQGNPLAEDIAGTKETVQNLTKNDIQSYSARYYVTDNLLLTVSGGIDRQKIEKLAEKYFNSVESGRAFEYKKFSDNQRSARLKVHYKKTEQANIILGQIGFERTDDKKYAEAILSVILGGGMSSRLFTEIREKRGLAYAVGTSPSGYIDTGVFASFAATDPKNAKEVIKIIIDEQEKIAARSGKITKKELTKAKEYIKGRTALSLEDTNSVNGFFAKRALFFDEIITPNDLFKLIDKVTDDEIYAISNELFNRKKLNLAIVGPFKSDEDFKKLLV